MNHTTNNQITQILSSDSNSQDILDRVFELMYAEIKNMANIQLYKLNAGKTITPTVLVNECYLKLSKPKELSFENRKHFIYTIARCMRQYLVDRVKQNFSQKRDGEKTPNALSSIIGEEDINFELLDLDKIISQLDKINPTLSELAVLKFFSGHSLLEIAKIQGVSKSTIMRKWSMAKSFIVALKEDL
ncbi:MAG: ECF-type sigma factor [Proteobacteria bacterium]|nr:ECF-type sigma factor [Pseudomonadota bacterium]